jgi:hypothetical protein
LVYYLFEVVEIIEINLSLIKNSQYNYFSELLAEIETLENFSENFSEIN